MQRVLVGLACGFGVVAASGWHRRQAGGFLVSSIGRSGWTCCRHLTLHIQGGGVWRDCCSSQAVAVWWLCVCTMVYLSISYGVS